ncbi:MAG: hypothetical protein ACKVP2_10430 [Burkholderiales bacterium]
MNVLRRLFGGLPGKVNDPVFGALTQRDGAWSGTMAWDHSPVPFALTVYRDDEVPSQADRVMFETLRRDYVALRPALQEALSELWSASRDIDATESLKFGGVFDLWAKLNLQAAGLYPDGHAELIFGFAGENLPEGAFIVAVHGKKVAPLEYVE